MQELVLIRGLPGAGKTTYAKTHYPLYRHFEADMYMMEDGVYVFDPKKLNYAHRKCQDGVYSSLQNGDSVVVTNTFIQGWEFDTYITTASVLNVNIRVIELRTQFGSIHDVPPEKMQSMKARWSKWEDIAGDYASVADITYEVVE